MKGRKVASFSIIMDRNRRSAQGEDGVQRIWKEYFEQLYNIDTQVQVAVQMCGFDGIRRDNYFGGEPIGRVGKLKTAKTAGGDEITEEIIKGGVDRMADLICRLCNVAFESGVVPEDLRSAMIVPLYKDK